MRKRLKLYTVELYDSNFDKDWKPAISIMDTSKTPEFFFSLKEAKKEGAAYRKGDPWLKYRIVVWDLRLSGYKRGSGNRFKSCEDLPRRKN